MAPLNMALHNVTPDTDASITIKHCTPRIFVQLQDHAVPGSRSLAACYQN
jgi:hypothetical protein